MLIPLISICHRCPFSESNQPGGCGGACACTADPQRRDINVMAELKECPHNLFQDPANVVYPPAPPLRSRRELIARKMPPMPIPDDFDPQREVRRMRQGGCCGKPSA